MSSSGYESGDPDDPGIPNPEECNFHNFKINTPQNRNIFLACVINLLCNYSEKEFHIFFLYS